MRKRQIQYWLYPGLQTSVKTNYCERFSMKSSYLMNYEVSTLWGKLWKLKIHDRMKLFLWRVMADAIPTRARMVCGDEETLLHLFKECQGARTIAFASVWGFRLES